MFRPMRRKKNEISLDAAKALLVNCKRGALAVQGDDGYPYTIPMDFYYDEAVNKIYFHTAKAGHKIESIRINDKVSFTTWDDGYLEPGDWAYFVSSCVVFGRAKIVEDQARIIEMIRPFALKYYPSAEAVEEEIAQDVKAVFMIELEIEHITGKKIHEQ